MQIDTCSSAYLTLSPRTCLCALSVLGFSAVKQQQRLHLGCPHPTEGSAAATFGHRNTARANSEQVWLCQSSEKGLQQMARSMGFYVGLPSEALLLKGSHFTCAIPQPERAAVSALQSSRLYFLQKNCHCITTHETKSRKGKTVHMQVVMHNCLKFVRDCMENKRGKFTDFQHDSGGIQTVNVTHGLCRHIQVCGQASGSHMVSCRS